MKHKETLPEQVQAFLQEQQMVQAGDTVCCALSGGADSVCLLRCLLELAEPLHLTITAVHVNHQLRGAESEQDAAFYAVEEDSSYWALLRWGGSLAEFDWSVGGPLSVEPRLWCRDVDGDGQEEIVLVNHVGSGTGVSIEELHIVEKNLDGTLTDYAFPEELWQEDLSSLLDTAVTADRTFAVLGEELVDITRQLPENLDPEVLRGLGTGSVARFDTDWPDSGGIRFNGSACLDADGYYYWYVADISAYVSYAGGVFTLSDFHLNGNE